MLTVIVKRTSEPTVTQMTAENVIRELSTINGAELLIEDSWIHGIRKVRTPYFCLVEDDCVLSSGYMSSNVGLLRKATDPVTGGGYRKLAMITSCIGVSHFDNRIYNYRLEQVADSSISKGWYVQPSRDKKSQKLYKVQVGFVPGAIIRKSALHDDIDKIPWDTSKDLIQLSTALSFHFWGSGRIIQVNPNTTYVSELDYLQTPELFEPNVPDRAASIFRREGF